MKKSLLKIFALCLVSSFLVFSLGACKGATNDNTNDGEKGNVENKFNFKVEEVGTKTANVSWNKDTSEKGAISIWVVSTNKNENPNTASWYNTFYNGISSDVNGVYSCTLSDLTPDTEYTVYLLGFNYDFSTTTTSYKKNYEKSIKVKTNALSYFKSCYISYSSYYDAIGLSWYKESPFDTAATIKVSRKLATENDYVLLDTLEGSKSTYDDKSFEFDTAYDYKLEAFDTDGNSIGIIEKAFEGEELPVPSKIDTTFGSGFNPYIYFDGFDISWKAQKCAEKYVVSFYATKDSTEQPLYTCEVTEPSYFYTRDDVTETTILYVRIKAVNKKGESANSDAQKLSNYTKSLSPEYTKNEEASTPGSVKFSITHSNKVKNAKVEYCVKNYEKSAVLCEYTDKDESEIKNLPVQSETAAWAYIRVTYTTTSGTVKVYESDPKKIILETKSFDAMNKPVVDSVTRTSATISFTPLTEAQLYGEAPGNVRYKVTAYMEGQTSSIKYLDKITSSPITITGLKNGGKYQFTVRAGLYGKTNYGDESEMTELTSLKAPLTAPVLSSVTEIPRTNDTDYQTTIKAIIPQIAEDADEEIEYGFLYAFKNDSSTTRSNYSVAKEYTDGEYTYSVNAGNTYYVFAYAQEKGNSASRVYSEESKKISLAKMNEKNVYMGYGKLTDDWFELLDFADPTLFGGNVPITTSVYNFNVVDRLKSASASGYNTVKLSYTESALAATPYIIFISDSYGSTYGKSPNAVTLGSAYAKIVKPMSSFDSGSTLDSIRSNTSTDTAGFAVPFDKIYNNAVYVRISSYDDKYIGLSYRY